MIKLRTALAVVNKLRTALAVVNKLRTALAVVNKLVAMGTYILYESREGHLETL